MKKYIYTLILLFLFTETLFAGNTLYSTFDLLQEPRITDLEAKVNDLNETKINTINDSIALVADSAVKLEKKINNLSDTVSQLSNDIDTLSASLNQYIKKSDNIVSDSITSLRFEKINGDTVEKSYVDNEIGKIRIEAENISSQVFGSSINNRLTDDVCYPKISDFNGVIWNVSDQTELVDAIANSNNYDVINLTGDIELTSTLIINKTLKFTGNYFLYSLNNSSSPTTLISVTADSVYFSSDIKIRHYKSTNTSVECAVNVNAKNFVSEANVYFMEFGYILRGSFNISGNLNYDSVITNSHRHIAIYRIDKPSVISNVTFDFPMIPASTAYANLIFISYAVAGDSIDANLKVVNCFQKNKNYVNRQFVFFEVLGKSTISNPSLWIENCQFNSLNGDIGFNFSGTQDLSFFDYIVLLNNNAGNAANTVLSNDYKGLLYLTGGSAGRDVGFTNFYSFGNIRPLTGRASYKDVIDSRLICYNSSNFNSANSLYRQENIQLNNSIYNYTHDIASKKNIESELLKKINISDSYQFAKVNSANTFTQSNMFYNNAYIISTGSSSELRFVGFGNPNIYNSDLRLYAHNFGSNIIASIVNNDTHQIRFKKASINFVQTVEVDTLFSINSDTITILSDIKGKNISGYFFIGDGSLLNNISTKQILNDSGFIPRNVSIKSVNDSYIVNVEDNFIKVNTGDTDRYIKLPDASICSGYIYNIKKTDTGNGIVVIYGSESQTIDDEEFYELNQKGENLTIISDGNNWQIL